MGWSSGTFSRQHDWTQDQGNGIKIRADRHDEEDDNLATGINTCLTKDGQNTPTSDLPMGDNKHTGVADADARTQYAVVGQVQDGEYDWVDGGGTADAITATYSPAITALVDGMILKVRATAANATTTPTFAPNGLTARTIVKDGGQALEVDEIAGDGHGLLLQYDLANTQWELLNPAFAARKNKQFAARAGVAGGATTNLGAQNSYNINITGTATITSFGSSASSGDRFWITFADASTLTHSANLMLSNNGNDILTAAGDAMIAQYEGSNVWRVYGYERADGSALNSNADTILTANSSVKTPSATNNYLAMTGSQINLPVGKWKLEGGVYFGNNGSNPAYFDARIRWASANGGDSATVPAAIESSANITLDAGVAAPTSYGFTGTGSVSVAGQAALPVIVTVATATTTVYLVPYLQATTAANGRVSTHLIATKINE